MAVDESQTASGEPGLTILVVEDLPGNALLVRAILSRQGYQVAVARTLESARHWLKSARPALILLDIELPDGSGLDLVRDLRRAGPAGAAVPVLAVSAHRDPAIEDAAREAGCNGFIRKPVNIQVLKQRIGEELRSSGEEAVRTTGPTEPAGGRYDLLRQMPIADLSAVDWSAEPGEVRDRMQREIESLLARVIIVE